MCAATIHMAARTESPTASWSPPPTRQIVVPGTLARHLSRRPARRGLLPDNLRSAGLTVAGSKPLWSRPRTTSRMTPAPIHAAGRSLAATACTASRSHAPDLYLATAGLRGQDTDEH